MVEKITEGVTCAVCKSIIFSLNGLIIHRRDNPTHRVYTFGTQYPEGALVIKLLMDIELQQEDEKQE